MGSAADGMHKARILLDGSLREHFVDGGMAWTTRTYKVPEKN